MNDCQGLDIVNLSLYLKIIVYIMVVMRAIAVIVDIQIDSIECIQ